MTCKKCRSVLAIDGRGGEPGSGVAKVSSLGQAPVTSEAPAAAASLAPAPAVAEAPAAEVATPAAAVQARAADMSPAAAAPVPAQRSAPEVSGAAAGGDPAVDAAWAIPGETFASLAPVKSAPVVLAAASAPAVAPAPAPRARARVALPQPRKKTPARASGVAPRPTRTQPQPLLAKSETRSGAGVALASAAAPSRKPPEQPTAPSRKPPEQPTAPSPQEPAAAAEEKEKKAAPAPELFVPPAPAVRQARPRPRMMSARVSGAPPLRARGQVGAALVTTPILRDAAVALEAAPAVAPLPREQPPEAALAVIVPPVAPALEVERPGADSKPQSQTELQEPLASRGATPARTAGNDEPKTGVTLARGREQAPELGDPSSWLQVLVADVPLPPVESVPAIQPFAGIQPLGDQSFGDQPLGDQPFVEPGVARRRWTKVGAGALALAGAVTCWMLWGSEPKTLPRERTAPVVQAAPVAALPIERAKSAPPIQSPAAQSPAAQPPADEAPREAASTRATTNPAAKGAAQRRPATRPQAAKKVAAAKPVESPSPPTRDEGALRQIVSSVVQKAEKCDLWGRPKGTAQLFITFEPSGRAKQARLVGEPIASAAVARCILHHARAASVPAFEGPAFTVSRKITLR